MDKDRCHLKLRKNRVKPFIKELSTGFGIYGVRAEVHAERVDDDQIERSALRLGLEQSVF